MVYQEFISGIKASQEDFHFLAGYCEICLATPIVDPNIDNIFRVLNLILPLNFCNGIESACCK